MAKRVKHSWIKSTLFMPKGKKEKKKWQQIYIIKKITISDKLKTHWQINRTLLLITTREVTVALFFNVAELGVCFKLTKDKSDMGSVIIERILE